jgi:hypothetical protein
MVNSNVCQLLLAALLPMISQPLPFVMGQISTDIPIQQMNYLNITAATEAFCGSAVSLPTEELPHPEQGGERITEDWLFSLTDSESKWRFRLVKLFKFGFQHTEYAHWVSSFTAQELVQMADILEIPDIFITKSRHQFQAVEALALLCARFSSAADVYDLSMKHDRSQSAISEIINELSVYLDETWKHLLDFNHHHLLSLANLTHYAKAIYQAGAPLRTIWSFIDCTLRHMCRPSHWQRQAYSGHKRYHVMKFQALNLPNGLFGHLFGPLKGCRNDNFLAEESQIFEKARQHAFREGADENTPIGKRYYQIFGDPAVRGTPLHGPLRLS